MKKIDIVNELKKIRDINKNEAVEIVDQVITIMKNGVKNDGELDIFGFVKMTKAHKEAGKARNPRTGEIITIPAKEVPKAKFSKAFKDFLNE